MNYLHKQVIIIGLALLTSSFDSLSQQVKLKTTRIRVEYYKYDDNSQKIYATILAREKSYVPLPDVTLHFFSVKNDTLKILQDKIKTNTKGEAIFTIRDHHEIFIDSMGVMIFEVQFDGAKLYKKAKKSLTVKKANLEVSFFQKDTSKFIEVNASTIGSNNGSIPLEGTDIKFYIKGTFSLLNIGNEETDENGKSKIEFPVDMPGDTTGVLTIVVKIEEHDDFGTLEASGKINWGNPIPLEEEKQRGLGDTDAPLWMVYTLIILLSAVWFHYLYVIFLIVRIKREEKNIKIQQVIEMSE